jgi:hypothetical protein
VCPRHRHRQRHGQVPETASGARSADRLCVLRGLELSVQIQSQHRHHQRNDQGARDSEQEPEHPALRRRRPASEQLPHVRDLQGPRSRLGEPGGGREGPAAQSRRRREPRHHADARAKYGGVSLRLSLSLFASAHVNGSISLGFAKRTSSGVCASRNLQL